MGIANITVSRLLNLSAQTRTDAPPLLSVEGAAVHRLPIAVDSRTTSEPHQDPHFTLQKACSFTKMLFINARR